MRSTRYREELRERLKLYAVTDRTWLGTRTLADDVEKALFGGITMLQLREKGRFDDALLKEAHAIRHLCRAHNVPFILNDRVELAAQLGADGIHVGQSDMAAQDVRKCLGSDMLLGVSCHTIEEARKAEAAGADYIGVGAIFPTATKADASYVTRDTLREICRAVSTPVIAIGGITTDDMQLLHRTGIAGVALVSAIFGADDIERETRRLRHRTEALTIRSALTIAGSDSSGGAGVQADMKSMMANGVYAMSAITALTAQNTQGVQAIHTPPPTFIAAQIDSVYQDIAVDAVKIGMLANVALIEVVRERLAAHRAQNIVLDPVMVATSGARLLDADAIDTLRQVLFPLADVVTPNIHEAELLTGACIRNEQDMETAAKLLYEHTGTAILLKGGHSIAVANDLLHDMNGAHWYRTERIDNPNTHGTGCTLSSAIAANLAKGYPLRIAVGRAKAYVHAAIDAMLTLGQGADPLFHDIRIQMKKRIAST